MQTVGIIGCGPMAQTLALELKKIGVRACIFNRTFLKAQDFSKRFLSKESAFSSIKELIKSLPIPRIICLSLKDGSHVDEILKELSLYLTPNDVVIDTGNSAESSLKTRKKIIEPALFLSVTICNGSELLKGKYTFLVAGSKIAYHQIKPLLLSLTNPSKKVPLLYDTELSFAVKNKQLHNLIEYGWMQLVMEVYSLAEDKEELFSLWNQWNPFPILDIASQIVLSHPTTLENINDVVYEKGTSKALLLSSIQKDIALPLSCSVLHYRFLSQFKEARVRLSQKRSVMTAISPKLLLQAAHLVMFKLMWEWRGLFHAEKIESLCHLWSSDCLIACPFWPQWANTIHLKTFDQLYEKDLNQSVNALKEVNLLAMQSKQAVPLLTSTYHSLLAI